MLRLILSITVLVAADIGWLNDAAAQQPCDETIGRIVSTQGRVSVRNGDTGNWQTARRQQPLCQGDAVRTGVRSRAAVGLINESVLRVDQRSTVRMENVTKQEGASSLLRLISGIVQFFSRKPNEYQVKTTTSTIGIRGTEFVLSATDAGAELTVLEGDVLAANDVDQVPVASGQSVRLLAGQAPLVQTIVRPRDLVQWGIFYPPVLSFSADLPGGAQSEPLRRAQDCARRGDSECVFDALDEIPPASQSAASRLLNAAMLMSVGRVVEAREAIDEVTDVTPDSGTALALRAVIAVAQNDVAKALVDGEQAVALSPQAAAPKIALSYAQQANLQLAAARDTLLAAVADQPEDALAWARLAELWLALGYRGKALSAAQRATEIDPEIARTQVVLGFVALARIDTRGARAAFEKALELQSADPLAHLGLGLAKIRDGELAEGRGDIEAAVALDSNNALLRPYLGRAYFAERRSPLDEEQYAVAKALDPLDPTAFLFSALGKQSQNRPVEAERDLRASIKNNDNRAVYRSRLALDQDRAARGTSLARINDDLGFARLGINESRKSLSLDPSSSGAHRFLSDTYANVRRREISRVSELLQAQMFQDININPVQPSVSSTNLNIASRGGTGDVGLNEFSSLFERDELSLGVTAFGGNNATAGGEAVVSGIYKGLSFSLGGFHYETDGWRDNNGQEQDIGNLFLQYAFTPEFNMQAEVSNRSSEEGDLAFNVDPEDFAENKLIERDLKTARVGARYSPTPNADILVSYIDSDRDTALTQEVEIFLEDPFFDFFPATLAPTTNEDGSQGELQYVHRHTRFNIVAGAAASNVDITAQDSITVDLGAPPPLPLVDETSERKIEHQRAYLYSNIQLGNSVTLTAGVSQDEYQEDPIDESDTSGKLGVQWQINDYHAVRAAAFQTIKPALVTNRTLEPTQVAGFNQFFDDINATKSTRVGLGYDGQVSDSVSWGLEATARTMEEPVIDVDTVTFEQIAVFEDREEQLHRIYAYWTPMNRIAVSGEVVYDLYEADTGIVTEFDNLPEKVETISVPISLRYFSPIGWFFGITATHVDQDVQRADSLFVSQADGEDEFTVVDLAVGYRFPKRRGIVSLELRNVGDEEFNYQDDSYREFRDEPATGPYLPETTGLVRATLSF